MSEELNVELEQELPEPEVVIIDADSLLYQICWKTKSPALAIKAMEDKVAQIIRDNDCPEAYVFVKGKGNFRFNIALDYKGNRVNSIADAMRERIDKLYEFCQENYMPCDGAEADDFCWIYSDKAIEQGKVPIVAHIDKDLNMIPGWHYNFATKKRYYVEPWQGYTFLMIQLLVGDAADNIKGVSKVGPITAPKLLEGLKCEEMLPKVLSIWEKKMGSNWKEDFLKAANLLLIRDKEEDLRPLSEEEMMDKLAWVGDSLRFTTVRDQETTMLSASEGTYWMMNGD